MSRRQQVREGRKALPIALIGQAIRKLTRHELEAVTERLIERLDELSGCEDMEDDDPAGTDLDNGEDDGANGWTRLLPTPTYANDDHNQTVIAETNRYGFEKHIRLSDYPMS